MHILIDEPRRQFETGDIDQATYETERATHPSPAENLCQTPGCTRQAYRVDRGVVKCAVCFQKTENRRRRGW